jgi:hypothetical protein
MSQEAGALTDQEAFESALARLVRRLVPGATGVAGPRRGCAMC